MEISNGNGAVVITKIKYNTREEKEFEVFEGKVGRTIYIGQVKANQPVIKSDLISDAEYEH